MEVLRHCGLFCPLPVIGTSLRYLDLAILERKPAPHQFLGILFGGDEALELCVFQGS